MARYSDFARLLPIVCAMLGCDGGDQSTPTEANLAQSTQKRPKTGDAVVTAVINHNPVLQLMKSDAGTLTSGVVMTLTAQASDPDGDELRFAWTTACPGSWRDGERSRARFVPAALVTDQVCEFDVLVSDGKGGVAKGALSLSSQRPVLNVAPQMGIVWQSTETAGLGASVSFHATAVDPEGGAIAWTWQASAGQLGQQTDAAGASTMTWTAPPSAGTYTITAVAVDPLGASAASAFVVLVEDSQATN